MEVRHIGICEKESKKEVNDYLNKDDFVHLGQDLEPGGQGVMGVHCKSGSVNGKDEAMYVSKDINGNILGYCHRCGKAGCHKVSSDKLTIDQVIRNQVKFIGVDNEVVGERFKLPDSLVYDSVLWPLQAVSWALKWITVNEATEFGVAYDPISRRIIIPVTK